MVLEGKVVQGKHEKMIKQEDFFKIHNLRVESTRFGISHKKENDDLPLKIFLKCDDCKQTMTGYIVKKKNLFYYKCRSKGCNCNKSAKDMHSYFTNELKTFAVNDIYADAITHELEQAYLEQNKETTDKESENKKR
jgi:site-specific DNA recombinase